MAKRSRAYRAIRRRVADPFPTDIWVEDDRIFFTFALRAMPATPNGSPDGPVPQAIFVLALSGILVAARLVEPGEDEFVVRDLLDRGADEGSNTAGCP